MPDAITPAQRAFLETLKKQDYAKGFYLAGGSGLALHLGHRRSPDHDLFRAEPFRPTELQGRIAATFGGAEPLDLLDSKASWGEVQRFFEDEVRDLRPSVGRRGRPTEDRLP